MHVYAMEAIQYFSGIFKERAVNPGDDIISQLMAAREDDTGLTIEELTANCLFLMVAGHETSLNMITNGILALLQNPTQLEQFKSDPDGLARNAIDEALRYDSPIQILSRIVQKPIQVDGVNIQAGEQLGLFIGAANRDPNAFENADISDSSRHLPVSFRGVSLHLPLLSASRPLQIPSESSSRNANCLPCPSR